MTPPRVALATLPTPLESGRDLPSGARLWVKRDDLTGLGVGGNKARKLEYLCGAAVQAGATCLVTVGAAQSNHCRMTAAAGTRLGLPVHLVVGGDRPETLTGNQLLSDLFGATLHAVGTSEWAELEAARASLTAELEAAGEVVASIPIGGSTAVGALGFVDAVDELLDQCAAAGFTPSTLVFTTSSGGTHAGLAAGLARARAAGHPVPTLLAMAVAPAVLAHREFVVDLANDALALIGLPALVSIDDIEVSGLALGPGYAVATAEGDEAIRWAARRGAWVMDRTYTGKGFGGLLAADRSGRFAVGDDVVFWHTGGLPALFSPGGSPTPTGA